MTNGPVWCNEDVDAAIASARNKASQAHQLLLKAARPVLQFGSTDEAQG